MKKFVIERNLPGAGNLSSEELQSIAQASCEVIDGMGNGYQWVQSFITEDKIYCIHIAKNEETVRKHAKLGAFPINSITEVKAIIDPMTAHLK